MAEADTKQWKNERLAHWATALWESSFRAAVSGLDLSGRASELTLQPRAPDLEAWRQWADPLWFDLPNDMAEGALLSVGCTREAVHSLIELITGEKDLEPDSARGTYVEILSQAAGLFGRTASEPLGKAAQFSDVVDSSYPADAELGLEYVAEWAGSKYLFALVPNRTAVRAMMSAGADQETAEHDSTVAAGAQTANGETAAFDGQDFAEFRGAAQPVYAAAGGIGPQRELRNHLLEPPGRSQVGLRLDRRAESVRGRAGGCLGEQLRHRPGRSRRGGRQLRNSRHRDCQSSRPHADHFLARGRPKDLLQEKQMMVPSTIFELWLLASPLLALLVAALALHLGAGQLRRRIALQKAAAEARIRGVEERMEIVEGELCTLRSMGRTLLARQAKSNSGSKKPIRKRRSERR